MIIGKRFYFDAAHNLPGHSGKCKNIHGHTYTLDVEVFGQIDTETRMLMDLHKLDEIVTEVLNIFDHKDLNLLTDFTTCENLARILKKHISEALPDGILLQEIKLQEGKGGWAKC